MSETQSSPRAAAKKEKPYHWFQGASVRELYNRLSAAGPDTARLEVRTEGDQIFFRVVVGSDPGAKVDGEVDINDSRRCPPICQ